MCNGNIIYFVILLEVLLVLYLSQYVSFPGNPRNGRGLAATLASRHDPCVCAQCLPPLQRQARRIITVFPIPLQVSALSNFTSYSYSYNYSYYPLIPPNLPLKAHFPCLYFPSPTLQSS